MRKLRNLKHIFLITLISLTLLFGCIFMFSDEFTNSMNGFFIYRTSAGVWQDYFHEHTLRPSAKDIVIIKIDERSLNAIQNNPNYLKKLALPKEIQNNGNDLKNLTLTKAMYTNLVIALESVGVKGIAFDIIFQNPDAKSIEQDFASTMEKYDNIVIGASYVEDLCQQAYGETWIQLGKVKDKYPKNIKSTECEAQLKEIRVALQGIIVSDETEKTDTYKDVDILLHSTGALSDTDKLRLYCEISPTNIVDCPGLPRSIYQHTAWGLINTLSSFERTLSVPIIGQPYQDWKISSGSHMVADTELYPLALSLYMKTSAGNMDLAARLPFYQKKLNREVGPESGKNTFKTILQPYFSAENVGYPSLSLIDVLGMSKVERKVAFRGKYVFVGEGGSLIHDELPSPVTGGKMDGVETHAHFLDGLLQDKMLAKASSDHMWIASIVLTILTIIFYFYLPNYLSPIFAIAILAGTLWTARYLYDVERTLVDIFPLFLSVFFITFTTTYIYRFFAVDREKRFIENAFSHYIDPKMVEMINMEEVAVRLGGEERELTVFFSDIAGFTTISETLSPQNLFWLMGMYLSRMTDILKEQGGTLDKYIGDSVMGFFGAPIAQADHAIRACKTAVAMRKALPELNQEIVDRGLIRVDFRVGIATGNVMVGNIGSKEHFNYTILGDTVNLASRLEAAGKEYHTHIIISEGTRKQIGERFELREIDTIAVQGKTEGVKIYELLGLLGDTIDHSVYTSYAEALALYRKENYFDAGKIWESQIESDPVSRVMALRCSEILKGNIEVTNGIYHMTHK